MNPLENILDEIDYYTERVQLFEGQLNKGQYYIDCYNRNKSILAYYENLLDKYIKGITGAPIE